MKRVLPLFLLTLSSSLFAQAKNLYGAIAWSPSTNRWGYSYNMGDVFAASQAAVGTCGKPDCFSAVATRSACAALAVGDHRRFGTAIGWEISQVQNQAESVCFEQTTGCRLLAWVCTE